MTPKINPASPENPIILPSDCIMSAKLSDPSLCGMSDESESDETVKDEIRS